MMMSTLVSFDNSASQDFPFPKPIFYYLLENTTPVQLKKLYKTCKYFYAFLQLDIIEQLKITQYDVDIESDFSVNDKGEFYDEIVTLKMSDLHILKKKLWIADSFELECYQNIQILFAKISRCDVKELVLNGELTWDEFKFLTNSKTVEYALGSVKIYYPDDTEVPLDAILQRMPNAVFLIFYSCHVTVNTTQNLLKLEFKKMLTAFCLFKINNILMDPELMNQFLKKYLENDAPVICKYESREMNEIFIPQLYEKLLAWKDKQPFFYPDFFP